MCSKSKPDISVVIPVYNSDQSLEKLMARLDPVLAAIAGQFEVILVNDSSRDKSWEVIQSLQGLYPYIRGICLMRNFGQHNALLCGIREAKFEFIATMDDDLQNPPEELPELIAKLSDNYDVVYGIPIRQQHGLFRDMASLITKMVLQNAMGAEVARNISAFRVFRIQLRDGFVNFNGPLVNIDVLLTWSTTRFAVHRVRHDARVLGVSNYTLYKLIVHALNMVTGFSTLPLQVASILGFFFTFLGIVILTYVVGRFLLLGTTVPGFAFLASALAVFSGAQMFGMGVIGEYLARIHLKIMDRPSYIVRSTLNSDLGSNPHSPELVNCKPVAAITAAPDIKRLE